MCTWEEYGLLCVSAVPMKTRESTGSPRAGALGGVGSQMRVLGAQPASSARAVSALSQCVTSLTLLLSGKCVLTEHSGRTARGCNPQASPSPLFSVESL